MSDEGDRSNKAYTVQVRKAKPKVIIGCFLLKDGDGLSGCPQKGELVHIN